MTFFEKYRGAIGEFASENAELRKKLLKDLCFLQAPSGHEEKRAEYCLGFLESVGAAGAYADGNKNVVFEYNVEEGGKATLICAHSDTVFPFMDPLPYSEEPENDVIRCPGVGDDTANVTAVLLIAKFFIEKKIKPEGGIIFLLDTCEETGGSGMKSFMAENRGRIRQVIVFDSINWRSICDRTVSIESMHIRVSTAGGHSMNAFGAPNAIAAAARIIDRIYGIEPPEAPRLTATYNVGLINGGAAMNKIAPNCEFDVEYRSNDRKVLGILSGMLKDCVNAENTDKCRAEIVSDTFGSRTAGEAEADTGKIDAMAECSAGVIRAFSGKDPSYCSAATSACIPVNMGIPAICLGSLSGANIHSEKEFLRISSLEPGLCAAIGFAVNIAV